MGTIYQDDPGPFNSRSWKHEHTVGTVKIGQALPVAPPPACEWRVKQHVENMGSMAQRVRVELVALTPDALGNQKCQLGILMEVNEARALADLLNLAGKA